MRSDSISVTACIPLYNNRSVVRRSVTSVLDQSFPDLQLIVLDDGSTDGSGSELQNISDKRFRLISQRNAGPGAARNAAWRAVDSEFVAFLDADDYWDSNFLARGVERLRKHPECASYTGGYRELGHAGIREGGNLWPGREIQPGAFRLTSTTSVAAFLATLTYMLPVSTLVRRSVLEAYGGFFDRDRCTYGEDSFLWLRVLLNHTVFLDTLPGVTVDRTSSSLSTLQTIASRPLEPALAHSFEIFAVCPPELRKILGQLLALKANKRCCTMAATGRRLEGKALRQRLGMADPYSFPYGVAAAVAVTPLGAVLAQSGLRIVRALNRER